MTTVQHRCQEKAPEYNTQVKRRLISTKQQRKTHTTQQKPSKFKLEYQRFQNSSINWIIKVF